MSPGGADSGGGGEVGGRQHGEDVEAHVVRQQRQRVRAARRAQVVEAGARRQLRGQEVQLRGAEVREQRGHQHRHLAVGELAHPPPDGLQPPPELLRVHLGGLLRVAGEDCLLVPPGQGLALAGEQEGVTSTRLLLGITPGTLALEHRGLCQDGLTSEFMLTLLQMSILNQDIKTEHLSLPSGISIHVQTCFSSPCSESSPLAKIKFKNPDLKHRVVAFTNFSLTFSSFHFSNLKIMQ